MANINMLFKERNYAVKFVNDCSSLILEAKTKVTGGKRLKI